MESDSRAKAGGEWKQSHRRAAERTGLERITRNERKTKDTDRNEQDRVGSAGTKSIAKNGIVRDRLESKD